MVIRTTELEAWYPTILWGQAVHGEGWGRVVPDGLVLSRVHSCGHTRGS